MMVIEATPLADWYTKGTVGYQQAQEMHNPGTQLVNVVSYQQGGLYQNMYIYNSSPATINNTEYVPSVTGYQMTLYPEDGNTTLKNLAGVNGQFQLKGGTDLTLTQYLPVTFVYNAAHGRWHQL